MTPLAFFMQLIDADSSQGEAETRQDGAAEVTTISSDLEPLPREKIRRVIRKLKFSHPLAHLDPNFLLKKQQNDARCQTQSGGSEDLVAGLPDTPVPWKCRNEVFHNLYFYFFCILVLCCNFLILLNLTLSGNTSFVW